MSAITYERPFHANLFYHVLSKVDLGRNAANLYQRPGLVGRLFGGTPGWAEPLAAALQSAPGGMTAQILPLVVADLPEIYRWLDEAKRPFDDWLGRNLAERLAKALRAEEREYSASFHNSDQKRGLREFQEHYEPRLELLLTALWKDRGRPALRIVDCEALANPPFTHGRCYRTPVNQVVAVSLQSDFEQVLIQILHEVTHAVTDPVVLEHRDPEERSTAAGSPGYALHMELERAVIEHDAELIERVSPELMPAYARWRDRYRV